jgi:hypothetical protein
LLHELGHNQPNQIANPRSLVEQAENEMLANQYAIDVLENEFNLPDNNPSLRRLDDVMAQDALYRNNLFEPPDQDLLAKYSNNKI